MTEYDLSKCGICGEPAQFTDADPGALPVSYDAQHLPDHFRARAEAGQMPLQDGSTMDELYEKAQELDIEGRSTMTKAQLQTAVAAKEATEVARVRNARVDPRDPAVRPDPVRPEPDRPTPPRRTAEAEAVEQQYVTEHGETTDQGTMSDAQPELELPDEDEAPKKATRKGSKKR